MWGSQLYMYVELSMLNNGPPVARLESLYEFFFTVR